MPDKKELITAQALSETLDLSVETIWRYTREKKIPYVDLGGKQYRYKLTDVLGALTGSVQEKAAAYTTEPAKKLTYQDYLELPDEPGYHYEILDGMLVREPAPNVIHQRVIRRLLFILDEYFREFDPQGEVFLSPLDVTFLDTTVVQPDIFYVSEENQRIIKEARIDGPPTLVVEVLSPSSRRRDRLQKLRIYQKVGIQHYWIVSPEDKTLECFSLQNNTYALSASGLDEDIVTHPDFPGLSVALKNLW